MRELIHLVSRGRTALLASAALLPLAGCPADDAGDEVAAEDSSTGGESGSGSENGSESSSSADTTGPGDTSSSETTGSSSGETSGTETSGSGTDTSGSGTETGSTDSTSSSDSSSSGDTTTTDTGVDPFVDTDGDDIPDDDDPFPMDPNQPGKALAGFVYAHTSSQLYTMDAFSYDVALVGNFSFNGSPGQVTDIAIDRWGVVYAVTFNDLFVCNPQTAQCFYLADLPQSFNGLTMVPPGTIDPDDDTLIGIANSGAWYQMTVVGQQAMLNQIGQYGNNMTSAGDVYSIEGEGTFGAVNKPGVNNGNVIVESNPLNGNVLAELATAVGYTTIYGLAGWQGIIFAFNSGGEIVSIDPADGTVTFIKDTPQSWWGAGVFTVLPQ